MRSAVTGTASNASPSTVSRVVCCCDDYQSFAACLNQSDAVLDQFGGTEIYQTSQSQVKVDEGIEHLRCMRLQGERLVALAHRLLQHSGSQYRKRCHSIRWLDTHIDRCGRSGRFIGPCCRIRANPACQRRTRLSVSHSKVTSWRDPRQL